jgi:2-polyprenyl-3-methyl-5-hydroxy-6-metoxy-1,4-benzoquinol methylase
MRRHPTATRSALLATMLRQLDIPVTRILDVGCGLGWYGQTLRRHLPNARYTGVEISEYLCGRHGWTHGSIVDLKLKGKFDLVICADVIQYLNNREAAQAIANLAQWCRGALYFHAPTKRDWQENIDPSGTDNAVHLRSGAWYRRQLDHYFVHAGMGVYVRDQVAFAQWELEAATR